MNLINEKIEQAFTLTQDLAAHLVEAHLSLNLPGLPSNKIGEQIWCIVGARKSYLNAIRNGKWVGFTCSLEELFSKPTVLSALAQSHQAVTDFINATDLTETQTNFLLDLLEHEIQHHGQLIRYIYGNKLSFPNSWIQRYTV